MSNRFVIRPKAASDLDDQALYLGIHAGTEIAHRFLIAAHETFSRLAKQPEMGWHPRVKNTALGLLRIFRVSGFEKWLVFYRPRPDGVDILRVVHGSRNIRAFVRREPIE